MAHSKSLFIKIANEKAVNFLLNNPSILVELTTTVKEDYKQKIITIAKYDFDEKIHRGNNNRRSATYSPGCGCVYCKLRNTYAALKLELHKKKKAFDNPNCYSYYMYAVNSTTSEQEVILSFTEETDMLEKQIKDIKEIKDSIKKELISVGAKIVEERKY